MRLFKVIDSRDQYRNDLKCEIIHDNEKLFVVKDNRDDNISRTLILNPMKFQEEKIVDEKEAILLMLKGVKVEEIPNERQ
jgi:hypothetical protein